MESLELQKSKIKFNDKKDKISPPASSFNYTQMITADDVNSLKNSINNSIDGLISINNDLKKSLNDISTISSLILEYELNNDILSSQINTMYQRMDSLEENQLELLSLKNDIYNLSLSGDNVNLRIFEFNNKLSFLSDGFYTLLRSYLNAQLFINDKIKNIENIIENNKQKIENNTLFEELNQSEIEYQNGLNEIKNIIDGYKLTTDTEINENKDYYIKENNENYVLVENPVLENISSYYEKLDVNNLIISLNEISDLSGLINQIKNITENLEI